MGVTIHFEGQLATEADFERLMQYVRQIAAEKTWLTERIEEKEVKLSRVRDEEDWDYLGPTKGAVVYVHEACEPVRFEFDRELYVQEFVKTQFAGPKVHVDVAKLLQATERFFRTFKVYDEGENWVTGDETLVAGHIANCNQVIEEELENKPAARAKVKLSSGRIVDLIR